MRIPDLFALVVGAETYVSRNCISGAQSPDDEIPHRISLRDYNWQNQFFVTLLVVLSAASGPVTRLQLVAPLYIFSDYISTKLGGDRYVADIGLCKPLSPQR